MYTQVPTVDVEKLNEEVPEGINWYMYFCTLTVGLLALSNGTLLVWTSPVIPQLISDDPDINPLSTPITSIHISILASIPIGAAIITPLVLAGISEKLGRLRTLRYMAPSSILALLFLAFIPNIHVYYICWAVLGTLRCGTIINYFPYINEIADYNNRGLIIQLLSTEYVLGMIFAYFFGSIMNVKGFTLMCALPLVIFVILSTKLVESPTHLASRGKTAEASIAFKKLNKCPEIHEKTSSRNHEIEQNSKVNVAEFLQNLKSGTSRRASLISAVLCFTQQLCGASVVYHFTASIFSGLILSGNLISIIVGLLQLFVVIITACVVEKVGKRLLILISSFTCSISMFSIASYFYLRHIESPWVSQLNWFPICSTVAYSIGFAMGLASLPLTIICEIFSIEMRSIALAISTTLENILMLTVVFGYPLLSERYGDFYLMWFYSFTAGTGFIILYFILPETTGKSLSDIQRMMNQ